MERLLSAKHWQLFVATYALPLLLYAVFAAFIFENIDNPESLDFIVGMGLFFSLFMVIMVIIMAVLYGWYYMVGTRLQTKIPVEHRLNTRYFKVAFFYPLLYILLFTFGVFAFFSFGLEGGEPPMVSEGNGEVPAGLLLIIPLHLLAIVSMFYCMYFLAKTIVTAERQESVRGSDFVGEFFLIWLWPIGIWFLQPRINAIWAREEEPSERIEDHFV
jgi:hypothetical protein